MADRDCEAVAAARLAARLDERERLSRIVHDGVLQVLAMVEREGPELGPRGQALAREAREQGERLRRLLEAPISEPEHGDLRRDLIAAVQSHQGGLVTVSAMSGVLVMPAHVVDEIDRAVDEVVSNVRRHAGEGAHCWILLEEEDGILLLSERDNGTGMSPGRAEEAAAEGRMGITGSIVGRIRALGGTTSMHTSPGRGVEWEFRIPIPPPIPMLRGA